MTYLVWWIKRLRYDLGLTGAMGLILGAYALVAHLVMLAPANAERAALLSELTRLNDQAARTDRIHKPEDTEISDERLIGSFPAPAQTPEALEQLYSAAETAFGLLTKADYKLITERGNPFQRYEIELPVEASYGEIRRFLVEALNKTPSLALEDIRFERKTTEEATVAARIRFTLYLRAAP